MVTFRKYFFVCQVALILLLLIKSASANKTTILSGISKNHFDSTIFRYMREIDDLSLVHLIVHSLKSDIFDENIVKSYFKFGIPLMILDADSSINRTNTDDNARRHPTPSKFRHIVAIFPKLRTVEPENWRIIYHEVWNPSARIVIFINDETIDRQGADRLLRKFWSIDCGNVVIASLESSTREKQPNVRIYGYDPFFVVSTKRGSSKINKGTVYSVGTTDRLFPEKMKNLRGHVIATSFYRHRPHATLAKSISTNLDRSKGLDIEIIRYAARHLNFTISLKTENVDAASHVVSLPSGKNVGPIGDILTGESEYLGNGQFLEVVHLYNDSLEFVYPYWRSHSVVVVQRASTIPAICHWTKGKEQRRQASIVFSAGGIGLIAIILYLRVFKRQNFGKTLLTIVELALFQHFSKIGKLTSERIFCIVWIYCTFVLCTIYQGHLLYDLTSAPIFDNIDKLDELLERTDSLQLMVRPYEQRILKSLADPKMGDETRGKLYEHTVVQLNFSACLGLMKSSKSIACSIDQSYGRYALGQVRRYELMLKKDPATPVIGNARAYLIPPIHIVDESLVDFWKTYVVRRGFPYLEMMNEAITRAVEFGLVVKWLCDDKNSHFREPQVSNEPPSLSMYHMDYTFVALIAGHVVATFALLCEIARARVQSR